MKLGCWNKDQLNLLNDLKKELDKELTQKDSSDEVLKKIKENNIYNKNKYAFDINTITSDKLFSRFLGNSEGIQYKIDDQWVKASFDNLDEIVFSLSSHFNKEFDKVAIGLPRVPIGISTWLAISVMASRVVAYNELEIHNINIKNPSPWILIACRERAIRDLYLSQRLLFSSQNFLANQFPIYRFKRSGGIQQISMAIKPNKLSTPVLFYHFDNIDFTKLSIGNNKVGLILTEISETDSRLNQIMLERLEIIGRSFNNPKTLLFFNSFGSKTHEYLEKKQYTILNLIPKTSVNKQICKIPSIKGTFSSYSNPQEIKFEIIQNDNEISTLLHVCARELAKINEEIQSEECSTLIAKWWNIWRTLKDLAIPVDIYERYRMHVQGRGTLENAIKVITTSADRIYSAEGKNLQLVAPTISNRLLNIYKILLNNCPKAEILLSLINKANNLTHQDTLFILSEKTQLDALKEQFLFTNIDILENNIPITYISQALLSARDKIFNTCILPGVWPPWQNPTLIAMGVPIILILLYSYEAILLDHRIKDHLKDCELLSNNTIGSNKSYIYPPIFKISPEQLKILTNSKEFLKINNDTIKSIKWFNFEAKHADESLEVDEIESTIEQSSRRILINLEDDTVINVRPHSEMMIVTDDGVETIFANELLVGDSIAIIKGDMNRSIFQSVLEKVNHLVRVDYKVIDIWRSSLRKIIFDDHMGKRTHSLSLIISSLRRLGCNRSEITIRQWFRGLTLAPIEAKDISRVLELAGVSRSQDISKVIAHEINEIRKFNRALGACPRFHC